MKSDISILWVRYIFTLHWQYPNIDFRRYIYLYTKWTWQINQKKTINAIKLFCLNQDHMRSSFLVEKKLSYLVLTSSKLRWVFFKSLPRKLPRPFAIILYLCDKIQEVQMIKVLGVKTHHLEKSSKTETLDRHMIAQIYFFTWPWNQDHDLSGPPIFIPIILSVDLSWFWQRRDYCVELIEWEAMKRLHCCFTPNPTISVVFVTKLFF